MAEKEIEVIENVSDDLSVIELLPEVRERHLRGYSPWIPYDALKDLYDEMLLYSQLSQRSPMPEINVNNSLLLLRMSKADFVVGFDGRHPEDHNILVSINLDIDFVLNGSVKYKTGLSKDTPFRPLYVRVFFGTMKGEDKKFDLSLMDSFQANLLWSYSLQRYEEYIRERYEETYEKWTSYTGLENANKTLRENIKDSEFVSMATQLGAILGRSFMVPKEIFRVAASLDGYSRFVDKVLLGESNEELFEDLRYDIQVQKNRRMEQKRLQDENYMRQMIIFYASERLPEKRFKEFMQKIGPSMSPESIQSLLDKDDLSMILKAIENNKKEAKGMTNNNCPHKKITYKLETSISGDDKDELLRGLKEYIPSDPDYEDIIPCKSCKYPLICPHDYIMQRGLSERRGMKEIKQSIDKYIYPDKVQGNYVCRICGQVILSISAFDAVIDQYDMVSYDEDPEVSALWSEISYMTKYVSFENLINRNSFVNNVVSLVWPVLQSKISQIMSSRGLSAEEMVARKRINNSLFIMAAFINLAITSSNSPDKDTVKVSLVYPSDTPGKDHNTKMFNYAINVIFDSLSTHIRRIPGLTKQMLVNDLLDAYRMISSRKKGPVIQVFDESSSTTVWLNNSFFKYICSHVLGSKRSEETILNLLDKIAPFKDQGGDKKKKDKKSIQVRELSKIKYESFKLQIPTQSPEEIMKKYAGRKEDAIWDYYKDKASKIFDASYAYMIHYITEVYPKIGAESGKKNNILVGITADKNRKTLAINEILNTRLLRYSYMKNISPVPDSRRYYIPKTSPLGYIYTDSGLPRKWNHFNDWTRPAGKKGPWVQNKDKDDKDKNNKEDIWVDSTGYKYGDKTLSDSEIMNAIKNVEIKSNMITFYEFICPKGDTHTFEDKKCTKCSYILGPKDESWKDHYYDTYKKEYEHDQEIIFQKPREIKKKEAFVLKREPVKIGPLDFGKVVEAAKYCDVPTNVIAALGSYEGILMKNIQDGKFTAPVTTNKLANRPDKLRGLCSQLIARYGSIVNIANNYNPSKEILDLLSDVRVPKSIMPLKDFSEGFMEEYDNVFYNNGPKDLIDFALGSFVDMILKLKRIENEHPELRKVFRWIIDGPLGSERLGTKPVITNWSVLLKLMKEESDANMDDTGKGPKEENEDEDNGDGMDLDNDNDDKMNTDGDDGNQIKLRGE